MNSSYDEMYHTKGVVYILSTYIKIWYFVNIWVEVYNKVRLSLFLDEVPTKNVKGFKKNEIF